MKAADIMSTDTVTIDSMATIAEAARVMKKQQVRALIVPPASSDDAYGIVTQTDITQTVAEAKNPQLTYVCQVMTKPCIVVNPDLAVENIPNLFARAKIRIAPVIKEKLLGVVSLTDILTKTDCLTSINNKLTEQQQEELAFLIKYESMESQSKIDSDRICDNWCSG